MKIKVFNKKAKSGNIIVISLKSNNYKTDVILMLTAESRKPTAYLFLCFLIFSGL